MFLAVPPELLHESGGGEVPVLTREIYEPVETALTALGRFTHQRVSNSPVPLAMSEQQKRVSTPENGHGGKRPRALAEPDGGVKQERRGQGQAEASQGGEGEGAVVAVQAMEEPQINVRIAVGRLHCHACLLPLRPPTFKCEAGHVVCSTCRGSHGQACGRAATYAACVELDDIVRDAKVPCAYEEYGCTSWVVYHEVADHHRSCRCGPCFCPESGCEFFTSPARLAEHFSTHHAWPATKITYGKPCKLAVPGPQGRQVLVGEGDGCVFLVSPCPLGAATAVSLVCVRSSGDAAAGAGAGAGAPQFRCKLWVEVEGNKENLALVTSMVASSDLSGGFVAADQGMFLAVPPELLHDESGEAPTLMVRIDRAAVPAASVRVFFAVFVVAVRGWARRVLHLPRQARPGVRPRHHLSRLPRAGRRRARRQGAVPARGVGLQEPGRLLPGRRRPAPGCELFTSPARLVEHFHTRHRWPVTKVRYGAACKLPVPAPAQGCHVLVGEEDRSVFLVSPCALGAATAVSLVCVRANGAAAAGAAQFKCTLWVELPSSKDKLVLIMSAVRSSDLSSGFPEGRQEHVLDGAAGAPTRRVRRGAGSHGLH
ncbi:hypothetical protein BAE44_0012401 [Dichanthelium oligosanthes]|uniref:SIAH-type domain-containing protein n=1 Tax=Dichanthelium oligosanthes TaxID=888268 RepID=A0A1E5VN75_9POAL|nr:hypothetical protein BAE44_0012401 [Dichanthelium oligosanthes]